MILRRRDGQEVNLSEGAPSLASPQVVFTTILTPPPEAREYSAGPEDEPPPSEPPTCAADGPTEDSNNMGKEEKSPRDYSQAERRVILEGTRGLGDKALKEKIRAGEVPVSRTQIYMWRKELWGTMNAHGIQDPQKRPVKEPTAEPTHARRSYTDEEKLRLLKHAEASGNMSKWAADSGIPSRTLYDWKAARDAGQLGPKPVKAAKAAKAADPVSPLRGRLVSKRGSKSSAVGPPAGRMHGPSGTRSYTDEQKAMLIAEAERDGRMAVARRHGFHPTAFSRWVAAPGKPAATIPEAVEPESGATPKRGRRSLFTPDQQREIVAAVMPLRGAERTKAAAKLGANENTVRRWSLQLANGHAPTTRAIAKVDRSDQQLMEEYDSERAVVRAARGARAAQIDDIEKLKLELLVCKANLQLAIRNGFLTMFDVEGLITSGGRKRG